MIEKLLLKSIGAKLVSEGDCPYDPSCIHADFDSCMASWDDLRKMEKKLEEQAKSEHHSWVEYSIGESLNDDTLGKKAPSVKGETFTKINVVMKPASTWPCDEAVIHALILPIELRGCIKPDE